MLTIDIDPQGTALVTIDIPERSMNVVNWRLADRIDRLAEEMRDEPAVRAVILTSGKRDFIVGADIGILGGMIGAGMTPALSAQRVSRMGNAFRKLERISKPVVVAAPGTALGAGLELMLAGHYRIAARNEKALFGLPEVGLGILPGAGGTQRLPRIIGIEAALPLLTGGAPVSAERALELGLLDELVAPDDLVPAARRALAESLVPAAPRWDHKGFAPPGAGIDTQAAFNLFTAANAALTTDPGPAYPAPRFILSCVWEGMRLPIDRALKVEQQWFGRLAVEPATPALVELRFFARQRAAKAGLRKPAGDDDPFAQTCRGAIRAEAARIRAEGHSANLINSAALAFDIAPVPLDPEAGTNAGPATRAELRPIARRMILAGALAVAGAGPDNPDIADIIAVGAGGFPAWTGGPLAMIDREDAAAVLSEAEAAGIAIPGALRDRARSGQTYHRSDAA